MTTRQPARKSDDPVFHYETEDGKVISLPRFKHIPIGLVRKTRKLPGIDQSFTILETLADNATLAVIDGMNSDEMNEFMRAWQADSGITAGESKASSGS